MKVYKDMSGYYIIQNGMKKYLNQNELNYLIQMKQQAANNQVVNDPVLKLLNGEQQTGVTSMGSSTGIMSTGFNTTPVTGDIGFDDVFDSDSEVEETKPVINNHHDSVVFETFEDKSGEEMSLPKVEKKPGNTELDIYKYHHNGEGHEFKKETKRVLDAGIIIRDDVDMDTIVLEHMEKYRIVEDDMVAKEEAKRLCDDIKFKRTPSKPYVAGDFVNKIFKSIREAFQEHGGDITDISYLTDAVEYANGDEETHGILLEAIKPFSHIFLTVKKEEKLVDSETVVHIAGMDNLTRLFKELEIGVVYKIDTLNAIVNNLEENIQTDDGAIVCYDDLNKYLVFNKPNKLITLITV